MHENMILRIADIDISEYMTDYDVSRSASSNSENGFTNWDGTIIDKKGQVIPKSGIVVSISVSLKKVPRTLAAEIASAVEAETFPVTYASPAASAGEFSLSSYRATARRYGEEWDIEISCDSDTSASESSGGYL